MARWVTPTPSTAPASRSRWPTCQRRLHYVSVDANPEDRLVEASTDNNESLRKDPAGRHGQAPHRDRVPGRRHHRGGTAASADARSALVSGCRSRDRSPSPAGSRRRRPPRTAPAEEQKNSTSTVASGRRRTPPSRSHRRPLPRPRPTRSPRPRSPTGGSAGRRPPSHPVPRRANRTAGEGTQCGPPRRVDRLLALVLTGKRVSPSAAPGPHQPTGSDAGRGPGARAPYRVGPGKCHTGHRRRERRSSGPAQCSGRSRPRPEVPRREARRWCRRCRSLSSIVARPATCHGPAPIRQEAWAVARPPAPVAAQPRRAVLGPARAPAER